jgi:hypothetical protein
MPEIITAQLRPCLFDVKQSDESVLGATNGTYEQKQAGRALMLQVISKYQGRKLVRDPLQSPAQVERILVTSARASCLIQRWVVQGI